MTDLQYLYSEFEKEIVIVETTIQDVDIVNSDFSTAQITIANSSIKNLTIRQTNENLEHLEEELESLDTLYENGFNGEISLKNMREVSLEFKDIPVPGNIIINNSPNAVLTFSGTTEITGNITIQYSPNVILKILDKVKVTGTITYEHSSITTHIRSTTDISRAQIKNIGSRVSTLF